MPAGLGSKGRIRLDAHEMDAMLEGGARWALERGYGEPDDLGRIEERGRMAGARPELVSAKAKRRQEAEMGTLGSGNHYLEVQEVARLFDAEVAAGFGLELGQVVITIHCGSRGLGHQIGSEFLREMVLAAEAAGIALPERELACAPIHSEVGRRYLGAMRAASTARSPTVRSSAISRAKLSPGCFPRRGCRSCSMSRTTPARSRSTRSMASSARSTSIARVPPAPSDRAIPICPTTSAPMASRS